MGKNVKISLMTIMIFCLVTFSQAQVVGDLRSAATGNWSSTSTWQRWDGTNWVAATSVPGASNSVYIESGHTITLTQNESCNDLNLNTTSGDRIVTGAFTLSVNGKFRAFSGSAPGTNSSSMPSSGWLNTSGGGKISVVGKSRTLVSSGEWSANPQFWTLEIALTPTDTITCFTNIKAGNITIASGTVIMTGSNTFRADSGSTLGNLTINSGATLRMKAGAIQRVSTASATSHFASLTVNGTLAFDSTVVGVIGAAVINLNGTVEYSADNQTLMAKGANSAGADPTAYTNLRLSGSGTKTLGANITINGALILSGTASLSLSTFTLSYAASSRLEYAGSAAQSTTSSEWPATGGPPNVTINNVNGVALQGARTLTGTLTLTSGQLINTTNSITLGTGALISRAAGSLAAAPVFGSSVNLSYSGSTAVSTGFELPTSTSVLNILAINNSAGVTLAGNATMNGVLTLNANLTTGSNVLTIGATGSVNRTSGHVAGNLKKSVGTGSSISRTFEIGTGTNYTPVTLTFASVTTGGSITGAAVASKHANNSTSGLSATKGLRRYWTLTNENVVFTTYDATFTFVPSDVDSGANPATFVVKRFSVGNWSGSSVGARTSTTTQATGLSGFGDFALGETGATSIQRTSGNNQSGPGGIRLPNPFVVTVRDDAGNPVPGIRVVFAIASTASGAIGQKLSVTDTITNSNGQASTFLTLGDKVGPYGVTATSTGLSGSPIIFTAVASTPSSVGKVDGVPAEFALLQNYPNPFNPSTTFEFRTAEFGFVKLGVFDMLGRVIATLVNEELAPGSYRVLWDASNVPSGVYVYRMSTSGFVATKKLVLIR